MFNLAALILLIRHATVAAMTCYGMNGDAAGSDAGLCNPSAKGTAGSHSACCSIGNGDTCLSTGLCLSSWSSGADGLLWASGCTDPTWQDPSCANFCVAGGRTDAAYALLACSNTTWCCSSDWEYRKFVGDKTECCKNSLTLPASGVGSVVRELGSATKNNPNPSTTKADSSSAAGASTTTGTANCSADSGSSSSGDAGTSGTSKMAAAIVAGVLGTALLASLVSIIVLVLSNRKLRRQLQTSQVPVGISGGYVLQPPNKSEMSTTPAPSFSPLTVPLERSELGGNSVGPAELGNMPRLGYN
ncbi:hypothetical protein C8A01DRAFT_21449 [Parachaetomium inaequale]|uniref:Uncharacterized protein n=1 Tax=Parachaetomium inaequale TaxID=2588326 RepID=A0AAN6P5T3_9PEZI|nr:hypothetical protein C8A01DRAFT_21449 [Parachaetomium inaequale]